MGVHCFLVDKFSNFYVVLSKFVFEIFGVAEGFGARTFPEKIVPLCQKHLNRDHLVFKIGMFDSAG